MEKVIITLDGKVYDVTSYVIDHPGGDIIRNHNGQDATEAFNNQVAHSFVKGFIMTKLRQFYIGEKGQVDPLI